MSKPAARVGDQGTPGPPPAGHLPPNLGIGPGSSTVAIGNRPAWRANIDKHMCTAPLAPPPAPPTPHGPETCFLGSMTVLIDNQMAVRVGDQLIGAGVPNFIIPPGCPNVLIGDIAFGLAAQANLDEF